MGVSSRTSTTAAEKTSAAEKFRRGLPKGNKTVLPKRKKPEFRLPPPLGDKKKKKRRRALQGKAGQKPARKREPAETSAAR